MSITRLTTSLWLFEGSKEGKESERLCVLVLNVHAEGSLGILATAHKGHLDELLVAFVVMVAALTNPKKDTKLVVSRIPQCSQIVTGVQHYVSLGRVESGDGFEAAGDKGEVLSACEDPQRHALIVNVVAIRQK